MDHLKVLAKLVLRMKKKGFKQYWQVAVEHLEDYILAKCVRVEATAREHGELIMIQKQRKGSSQSFEVD